MRRWLLLKTPRKLRQMLSFFVSQMGTPAARARLLKLHLRGVSRFQVSLDNLDKGNHESDAGGDPNKQSLLIAHIPMPSEVVSTIAATAQTATRIDETRRPSFVEHTNEHNAPTSPTMPTIAVATKTQWHFIGTILPAVVSSIFVQPSTKNDATITTTMHTAIAAAAAFQTFFLIGIPFVKIRASLIQFRLFRRHARINVRQMSCPQGALHASRAKQAPDHALHTEGSRPLPRARTAYPQRFENSTSRGRSSARRR